jgi:hypothetical protein
MTQRKPWTDEEVQQLREHYNRGAEALLVLLLERPWTAIRAKAQKLGVLQEKRTTWKTCPTCQRSLLRAANFYERSNGRRGTRTESRCKDCCARLAKEWTNSTPERRAQVLERQRQRHERTREQQLEYMRQRNRRVVDGLEPKYVALTLGLKLEEVPEALLEAKREQLTLRRLARQLKEAAHESSEDAR